MPRTAVWIDVNHASCANNGERQQQKQTQPARGTRLFTQKQRHAHQKQEAHHNADGKLTEEILEDSKGVTNQKQEQVIVRAIEIRAANVGHPPLEYGPRFPCANLRKMGLVQERGQGERAE